MLDSAKVGLKLFRIIENARTNCECQLLCRFQRDSLEFRRSDIRLSGATANGKTI